MPIDAVGYVVNTYPRPSHSFIRREILSLEADGLTVCRFAMRRDSGVLVDAEDRAEQARTEYILDNGAMGLAGALLSALVSHPKKLLAGLKAAVAAGKRGGQGRRLGRQLIYLAEAAWLARRAREMGLYHLHAHFGTNSTDVVRYAAILGGPGYSFTVHGPEEFDAPVPLALTEKLQEAQFAVAVSSFGRSQLSRWVGANHWSKLHVVHCGIQAECFSDPLPLPERPSDLQPLRLVAIGRFVEQKGQLLLIEALAKVQRPVHLTLVGDGELMAVLQDAIARHGLRDQVTLTGWLDEAGVRAALGEAHALVLPSFAEGLPVVLMEAMAAARPSISTIIAGIPELTVAGETGWLVPAGDAEALAAAIDDAATTPNAKLAQMGQLARRRVLARHDVRQEADKLQALFQTYYKT